MTDQARPPDVLDLLLGQRLQSAFGAAGDGNWGDVERRARLLRGPVRRSRRFRAVAAAVLAIVVLAAPALAFRGRIVEFFSAAHAPKVVVYDFGRLQVMSPSKPGVFPRRGRRVTSTAVAGTTSVLYVAPTSGGGFCEVWTGVSGPTCLPRRGEAVVKGALGTLSYSSDDPSLGLSSVDGSVLAQGSTITLVYADGSSSVIPYVWVTAPIDAGFFRYAVPGDRRTGSRRPVAVTVTAHGKEIGRATILDVSSGPHMVDHQDRWGRSIQTPAEAVWARRRLLVSFNAADGSLVTLYVMPSRLSPHRRCFAANTATGCEHVPLTGQPLQLQLAPVGTGATVVIWGETTSVVRTIRLRFQDNTGEVIRPRDGFVLARIPAAHYPPGHRLATVGAFDADGHRVGRVSFSVTTQALYPCPTPRDYGYGVRECR